MLIEAEAMKEIHEIRERIYEERKDMTVSEYNERVRLRSRAFLEHYKIKLQRIEPEGKKKYLR